MKRYLISLIIVLALVMPVPSQAGPKELKVLGQPMAIGMIQKKEQAFFENFSKMTGIDIKVTYTPLDVTGIKSSETLRLMRNGLFDIVSIRGPEASQDEPFLLGMDLVGLNPDFKTAHATYDVYRQPLADRFKSRFKMELLGMWCFGPQVLFCKPQIAGIKDLKGKKVSASNKSRAIFLESLGAIPVAMDFSDVQQSLAKGVIDCAITGASSANSAGWTEVTEYFMPIGFQAAFNGYGISLNCMEKFRPEEQEKIRKAVEKLVNEIWVYAEELHNDALRCNVGDKSCTMLNKASMKLVPVQQEDIELFQNGVRMVSYPAWAGLCDKSSPGCSDTWKSLLGSRIGLK